MALYKLSEVLEKGLKGITTHKVKLVRHAGGDTVEINGKEHDYDPYALYINEPDLFLQYQSEQRNDVFKGVDYIVSFIGEEGTTARMIGVFKVDGYDNERRATVNPKRFYYHLSEVEAFREQFNERIIIDWGPNPRTWHQWLRPGKEDKDVLAIERQGIEWKYPSYEEVILTFEELKRIIKGDGGIWKHKLTSVKGIYVIADKLTGNLYVGSAYQEADGLWGRWKVYAATGGHGNNVILEEILKKDPNYVKNFQWGILQTCPLRISDKDILNLEKTWKKKFGKKACALNGN